MNHTRPIEDDEPYLCVYCKKPIADISTAKENEYGEFWCSPACEQDYLQNKAEAAYERWLDNYYGG